MSDKLNFIYNAMLGYKTIVPNPLIHSLLLSALAYYGVKKGLPAARKLVTNGVRQLTGYKVPDYYNMLSLQEQPATDKVLPWIAGLSAFTVPMYSSFNPTKLHNGWLSWDPAVKQAIVKKLALLKIHKDVLQLKKTASDWSSVPYDPNINFSQTFSPAQAIQLINATPYVSTDPYARNLGVSIINGIDNTTGRLPNLGNLYDSALNKFLTKLTFSGLANTAIKASVSAGLAGMFTDVVGTVLGFPGDVRNTLSKATSVGSALYSILT